jgi:translation elongation factor P/translation initiation factor 5A
MASSKVNLDEMEIQYLSANDLRKGSIVLLREKFPCKVADYAKAKTGKYQNKIK